MNRLVPVELVFSGEPFSRSAVTHLLRHVALRAGWKIVKSASRKMVYVTADRFSSLNRDTTALYILSHGAVGDWLKKKEWIGQLLPHPESLPFPFPEFIDDGNCPGIIPADIVAGSLAVLNLLYEEQTGTGVRKGGIRYRNDWWPRLQFRQPQPLVDRWLERVCIEAEKIGWPVVNQTDREVSPTIVSSHDVDYLPGRVFRGVPRLVRSFVRQLLARRLPVDALRVMSKTRSVIKGNLFDQLQRLAARQNKLGISATFALVVNRESQYDPWYAGSESALRTAIATLMSLNTEICLHGSYFASRTDGLLAKEKCRLELLTGAPVRGYRQHYLNFHPAELFEHVDAAGFDYDMSVGYNDMSGPRAGTVFPYVPYLLSRDKPCRFVEIPFLLMDTTLATTFCFDDVSGFAHCRDVLQPAIDFWGTTSFIWHQEQFSGALDPGYDRMYWRLVDWFARQGGRFSDGCSVARSFLHAWEQTFET